MKIIRGLKQMHAFSQAAGRRGKSIGFVPTMGALHQGHLSLIEKARSENDITVVSIFVNPIQFGPKEDLKKYPRDLKRDALLCKKAKVDIIFFPQVEDMYSPGHKTYVTVEGLSDVLCGRFRPGHFKGVATVVLKLFNIVSPADIAYFGQKDAQQAIIIKRMADDLNIPVKIKVMPTVREKGGLAMSSRNIYLSKEERQDALVLRRALCLAQDMVKKGVRDTGIIIKKMKQMINAKKSAKIQYISITDLVNLKRVNIIKDKVLIALAVYIGKTRMIDNIIINPNVKFQNLNQSFKSQ